MPDSVQRTLAIVLLALASPVLLVAAIAIRLDSRGSPFYRATRIGAGGRPFGLIKLRTMRADAGAPGARITAQGDPRITRVGRALRDRRIDELPQLWNVARGEMRLVGPRPEDPEFVDPSNALQTEVLRARPGITGLTQLVYINEAALLDPLDPTGSYRRWLLPRKLELDATYLRGRSWSTDLRLLWLTLVSVTAGPRDPASLIESMRRGRG